MEDFNDLGFDTEYLSSCGRGRGRGRGSQARGRGRGATVNRGRGRLRGGRGGSCHGFVAQSRCLSCADDLMYEDADYVTNQIPVQVAGY
uniref:H/ACA ribonucleoprotein complex subunit 1-like protein 1-like n=1 Tax=Saccoglossus kowalevskii TaxID=10224 RepID=A0ABM0GUI5_SACKO|nr:PREDICTED: putative H/ACA ribonucleoprotein complex subunit 1-like protein 1-like [Saccoglossus kowalevskii]